MRFLEFIKGGIVKSVTRFPVVTLVVLLAMFIGFQLVSVNSSSKDYEYTSYVTNNLMYMLFLCNFSMLLGLTFDLFIERNPQFSIWRWPLQLLTIIIGVLLYNFLDVINYETNLIKMVVLCLSGHFAVASFPFIRDKSWKDFWSFNKDMFIRIILSAFYSGVIFLGLSIAILAQKELLNLYQDADIYGYMAVLVFIGFNTLFFISGLPRLGQEEVEVVDYPSGLKIFAGYVLLPLVALYLLILLLFELKIIFQGTMPEGFVSWMVFCFAVAGILSFLLLYPIIGNKENKWIQVCLRVFTIALIPLLVLLWWAIFIRLGEYGMTEMRYLHICLSIWLTFFVLYFIIKNNHVIIKWLPLSLAMLGVFTSLGPWGYSSLSKNAQLEYVEKYIETKDSLLGGQMYSKIDYLVDHHGYESLSPYMTAEGLNKLEDFNSKDDFKYSSRYEINNIVQDNLIFEMPESNYPREATYYNTNVSYKSQSVYDLENYKYAVELPTYMNEPLKVNYKGLTVDMKNHSDESIITINYDGQKENIDLRSYVNNQQSQLKELAEGRSNGVISIQEGELLNFYLLNKQLKLIIHEIDFSYDKDTIDNIWNVRAVLLFN